MNSKAEKYNWNQDKISSSFWISSEECTYENRAEAWLSELHLCGCVDGELIAKLAIQLLTDFENKSDRRVVDYEAQPELYYLLTDKLQSCGMIEHGGSIRYPWLSDFGKEWLAHKFLLDDLEKEDE